VTSGGVERRSPTEAAPELRLLASTDVDQLAGLVFELAAQLHVERQRRLALEEVLVRRHVVNRDDLERLAADERFGAVVADELAKAQQGLLDVLLEDDDARTPLRRRDPHEEGG
jgi:hypothetical protein